MQSEQSESRNFGDSDCSDCPGGEGGGRGGGGGGGPIRATQAVRVEILPTPDPRAEGLEIGVGKNSTRIVRIAKIDFRKSIIAIIGF